MIAQVLEPPPEVQTVPAPGVESAGYLAVFALLLMLALVLNNLGCGTSLSVHERMGALSRGARRSCKQNGISCAAALVCARQALDAGEAIQTARKVQAEGREDPEATARALALPAAAEAACKAAGIKPEVRK